MAGRANGPRAAVAAALAALRAAATSKDLANLARFGIAARQPLGVSMANVQKVARGLGVDHALADPLWATDVYEARLLVAFVADPAALTRAQMDRWCRDFDNWGVCDTLCFKLFDRSRHAWAMVPKWCARRNEFEKRAGFALIACLAGHDKTSGDEPFLAALPWIEQEAADERNFVKKAVNWALRGLGRRNRRLHAAAVAVARRLAGSAEPAARWVGKDALRELTSAKVVRRVPG